MLSILKDAKYALSHAAWVTGFAILISTIASLFSIEDGVRDRIASCDKRVQKIYHGFNLCE